MQYNLLKLESGLLTVETRCRREVNGAWGPDAIWMRGAGKDPAPRYTIKLSALSEAVDENEPGSDMMKPDAPVEFDLKLEGEVHVPEFYIGLYPVTNEEYNRFLEANPDAPEPDYWANRKYNQSRQPVVGVSWEDAKQYAAWAGLYLPTEAQCIGFYQASRPKKTEDDELISSVFLA